MTAALYLLRSGANIALAEKLSPGGQILLTDMIENYPGFPEGVHGFELADRFAAHLAGYEYDKFTEEVSAVEPGSGEHVVVAGDNRLNAKTIVICSGARYRKLGIPGEEEFLGKGVSYCALCDGNFFRDQVVAVIGGGNAALEEALYLANLARKVYLIHRRDEFRGAKCYQDKCFVNPRMQTLRSTIALEVKGDRQVKALTVKDLKSGRTRDLKLDGVFIFVGFDPNAGFLPREIETDQTGFIKTDQDMKTSVSGIFAAGDIRSKTVRQVTTAVGDAAVAANSAFVYLEQL